VPAIIHHSLIRHGRVGRSEAEAIPATHDHCRLPVFMGGRHTLRLRRRRAGHDGYVLEGVVR
jgi:hypothetical protein